MKILFIIPYVPNQIRVRPYNFLRSLVTKGHEVTLLTLWSSDDELEDVRTLTEIGVNTHPFHLSKVRALWNCVLAVPSSTPLQSAYSWQPQLAARAQSLLSSVDRQPEYDLIHVEHMRGVRYGLAINDLNRDQANLQTSLPPVVWDSVDCISHLFRQASEQSERLVSRWITRFELGRTERYEGSLTSQFDRVLVTSQTDRDALLSLTDGGSDVRPIQILTNGVDLNYFKPDDSIPRETDSLVVSGKMSYHANVTMVVHLVKDIMPRVWEMHPTTRLYVVGKDPAPELLKFAQDPRVIVTGTVDDIRKYLRRSSVAVSPIPYGAGIQNKILEAMACETPVITSPLGAGALEVKSGREILVAGSPNAFADAVISLLKNPGLSRRIARAGRRYVEENHSWENITTRLVTIYEETLDQTRTPIPN